MVSFHNCLATIIHHDATLMCELIISVCNFGYFMVCSYKFNKELSEYTIDTIIFYDITFKDNIYYIIL